MKVRLWVTGVGLVTLLGAGVEETWAALVAGKSAIGPLTLFDGAQQRASRVAQVTGVVGPADPALGESRTSAMALDAAREAMVSAGVTCDGRRVGLVVGGTTGGMLETEKLLARLRAEPQAHDGLEALEAMRAHPLSATGDHLDARLGPFARVRCLSSACSSGANAVVVGAAWLLAGEVDVAVVGGADALCRLTLTGFNALGAIDPDRCRPFDRRRRGTTLGEGAGFLVLERAPDAAKRGARPIAALSGWALGAEAHHITNPDPAGVVVSSLMGRAMARAGLAPGDIDYVNAHGTATPANDAMEGAALARVLGDAIGRVPVSSSKGQLGHTLGAAGGIEAAITALVVARRTLVPTVGLEEPDPALPLFHVLDVGRPVDRVRAALSNAFGFGGMSTVLVFTEPDAPEPRIGPADAVSHARVSRAREAQGDDAHRDEGGGPPHVSVGGAAAAVITGVSIVSPLGVFGRDECARLVLDESRVPVKAGAAADTTAGIDPAVGRRLDAMARLAVTAVASARTDGRCSPADAREIAAGSDGDGAGVILGSAFGNIEATAAFLQRAFDKGPRFASPNEFPNLVPSSPVGHASIFTGTNGPAFATADLGTSGECAFAQAVELVFGGDAPQMIAGAVESASPIADRALAPIFAHLPSQKDARRADLAAAVVVEVAAEARRRGVRPLARVVQVLAWRGDRDSRAAIGLLVAPRGRRPVVVAARIEPEVDGIVASSRWRGAPSWSCARVFGESDALGAAAIAVAAARLGTGEASDALVVSVARDRGYAIALGAP